MKINAYKCMHIKFIRKLMIKIYVLCRIGYSVVLHINLWKILKVQSKHFVAPRREGKKSGKYPPLSSPRVRSCKRLTQPFHASGSIQLPHPNSNRIHGNRSTFRVRGFLFSSDWKMLETIEQDRK